MTPYRYDIERIKANPLNRINAQHIDELCRYAERDLQRAKALPQATAAQVKAKDQAVAEAQQVYDERLQKLTMYRKAFPETHIAHVRYQVMAIHGVEEVFCFGHTTEQEIISIAEQQLKTKHLHAPTLSVIQQQPLTTFSPTHAV